MKDYVYPKVPNYYHDSVQDTFFDADDLVLIEKLDGSNCKICVYDDRYSELYGEDIHDHDPSTGDVFVSSKTVVRGRLSDPVESFDDAFARLVHALRDRFNADAVRDLHDTHNSPLVLYGEHMVKHTLDYGYGESPPPAFIGFDVLRMNDYSDPPANPFDERFEAFLSLSEAYDVFDAANLETAPVVERITGGVRPDSLHIPVSEFANVKAEGVVLRSDAQDRRVKHVSEEFRERAQESWGLHESDAESGVELFSARYLTNARIRKTVNKLLHSEGEAAVTASAVAQAVVADAWEEELDDIQSIRIPLVPRDVFSEAETRSEAVIETMQTNAALNGTSLGGLWEEYSEGSEEGEEVPSLAGHTGELSRVVSVVADADDTERALVEVLVPPERVHAVVERIAGEDDRDLGRWVITGVCDELEDVVWYASLDVVANLPVEIVPSDVDDALVAYVTELVEEREDVTIDEKPDDWRPSIDDAEADGLGQLF